MRQIMSSHPKRKKHFVWIDNAATDVLHQIAPRTVVGGGIHPDTLNLIIWLGLSHLHELSELGNLDIAKSRKRKPKIPRFVSVMETE